MSDNTTHRSTRGPQPTAARSVSVRWLVPGLLAVVCTLLGTAGGAVAGSMITGAQIENGTVTGKDVKDRSLKVKDLSAATAAALRGPEGPRGPAGMNGTNGVNGTNGANGTDGTDGTDGISGREMTSTTLVIPNGMTGSVSLSCEGGRKLVSATAFLFNSALTPPIVVIYNDDDTATAALANAPGDVTLKIQLVCATAL